MAYTNRFWLLILFVGVSCAALYWVLAWIFNAISKKTAAKVEVEHEFDDKVADYEIEKLRKTKAAELRKAKRRILGAAK